MTQEIFTYNFSLMISRFQYGSGDYSGVLIEKRHNVKQWKT